MTDLDDPASSSRFAPQPVTRADLFAGFLKIGLLGFGGVAPWARQVIVEERGWLSDEDYAAVLGFGQVLPGANTVNAAVIIGDRFQGPVGSALAVTGLLAAPLVVLVGLSWLYDRFAAYPDVRGALGGVAAGAAGLVAGTGVKMAMKLKPDAVAVVLGGSALVAVAGLQISLVATVLVVAPVGLVLSLLRPSAR